MTYFMLKNITSGLLTGDNVLPSDPGVLKGLVSYAMSTVATRSYSMHLMTLDPTTNIMRIGEGDYYIRAPRTPVNDDDIIDIDRELTFAVARYIASYLSRDKGGIHVKEASRIILDFNSKVTSIMESVSLEAIDAECDIGAV